MWVALPTGWELECRLCRESVRPMLKISRQDGDDLPLRYHVVRHEAQRSARVWEWSGHVFMAPVATREDLRDAHFSIDRV